MNDHDSEKVAGVLLARGYRQVDGPEAAKVILYNTCSIREKAAQKVFSRLGELRPVEATELRWIEESKLGLGKSASSNWRYQGGRCGAAKRRSSNAAAAISGEDYWGAGVRGAAGGRGDF